VATVDPEPAEAAWALPVLDEEALAMIGAAASRAFDEAVLRDFETALAQCDDTGTAWDDGTAPAGAVDDTERLAAADDAATTAPVAPPGDLVAARVAVEFESKPATDDWAAFGAGQAPIAALVDKRGPKGDRTRDTGPDRVKARVAAH
jgi:hypothetical protein